MRSTETFVLANDQTGALTGSAVAVKGGLYAILASGTLGSTPTIEVEDPEGQWNVVGAPSLTGATVYLPAGQVRVVLASGASAAYVTISRVPFE